MSRFVTCTNLATGDQRVYLLPPEEAVVAAHEQARGNFNTWEYDYSEAQQTPSGRFWSCGDWTAPVQVPANGSGE